MLNNGQRLRAHELSSSALNGVRLTPHMLTAVICEAHEAIMATVILTARGGWLLKCAPWASRTSPRSCRLESSDWRPACPKQKSRATASTQLRHSWARTDRNAIAEAVQR